MFSRLTKLTTFSFALLVLFLLAMYPSLSHAQCSEVERTAVFVVSGIYPGTSLELERVYLRTVGEATYPDNEQMIAAITAIQPGSYYFQLEYVDPFYHYYQTPGDHGGIAIVDGIDGFVVFAGTLIHLGTGNITVPASSTHQWNYNPGYTAAPPVSIELIASLYWPLYPYGSALYHAETTINFLREFDVLQSFGNCGEYVAYSFIYRPDYWLTIPVEAKSIIIVQGFCGSPWSGDNVQNEFKSWGSVKAMFR